MMNHELGRIGVPVIDPERAPLSEEDERSSVPRLADVKVAKEAFTPVTVVEPTVDVRTTLLKFTEVRLALLSDVPASTVPVRFVAELILTPTRFAFLKFAFDKLAPLKFA